MNIKDVKLIKGMSREEINLRVFKWIELKDEIYLGNNYPHNWTCLCGETIKRRTWASVRRFDSSHSCIRCNRKDIEDRHKFEVEKYGDYEYIETLYSGHILPNGRKINKTTFVKTRHKYCNEIYIVEARYFIELNHRCQNCCGSYENSFAYHIEVELNEPLEKYWDFEKNTVNPYHISMGMNGKNSKGENVKVWIKCQEKDYHGSYEISCNDFVRGHRCGYCYNRKIHPKDSFAQYHIDNTDKDFLTKYWSDKNTVDPWSISPMTHKKVWIKCQKKYHHNSYEISCNSFTRGNRCPYCNTFASKKVHPLDSFGYHNFDKVMSWHPDNDISPFKVAPGSSKKYKFICETCGYKWSAVLHSISKGHWCPQCASSKGEKEITKWLRLNNIEFIPQKTYVNLLGLGGGNLSYDFYLPNYNLLIEYQGGQHEKYVRGFYTTKDDFKRQQEHDKRKREYAKENNIRLLEIWYWDFDNIDEILKNELNI